jgi:hypothetical protein
MWGKGGLNKDLLLRTRKIGDGNCLYILIKHHGRPDVCRDKQRENGDGRRFPTAA